MKIHDGTWEGRGSSLRRRFGQELFNDRKRDDASSPPARRI